MSLPTPAPDSPAPLPLPALPLSSSARPPSGVAPLRPLPRSVGRLGLRVGSSGAVVVPAPCPPAFTIVNLRLYCWWVLLVFPFVYTHALRGFRL